MSWRVLLTTRAARDIRKLDAVARRRIQAMLETLATDPRPPAATQLAGGRGEWRVRSGDYRVIYEIEDARILVLVIAIGHRREIYRSRD